MNAKSQLYILFWAFRQVIAVGLSTTIFCSFLTKGFPLQSLTDANNNPLQYAEITLIASKGANRHKLSKQNGTQHFERLKPDTFIITVTLPNYTTQTQSISTLAPQTLNMVFVMEATANSA